VQNKPNGGDVEGHRAIDPRRILVTEDDADWVARVWRSGGRASRLVDRRPPFS